MQYSLGRGILWIALFTALALVPLGVASIGPLAEWRAFMVELGVALGFVALALFALQFVFSGRLKWIAPEWGMDNIIQFHREIGLVALLFVLAHPVMLLIAEPEFVAFLDPRVNAPRAILLVLATLAAIVLVATSLWRQAFRLEYEWWRLVHGTLGVFIIGVGVVHAVQVRYHLGPLWKQGALVVLIGGCGYILAHTRLVRPWRLRSRPWRVVGVEGERDDSWSLTLEPDGHDGMRFLPGQFAWLTINDTPFTLQQHPFSFASSARAAQITFTAKELGDFTSTWKHVEPGTRAYLEGPFGAFIPDPSPDTGLFMIMGGIGVTPALSMLRTLRDDGDRRPLVLIYGNQDWERVAFREELEELQRSLNLRVVHLLEEPPDDWPGESGLLTCEMIGKYLPERPDTFQYFTCGPKPLMDIAEISLRELGVPWHRIYTERFEIV
jgi:predicted ferric reductase